ncbi:catabolite repressor/activator [Marinobacter halotolerans]|uniref:catabolite repressor/activator n=1 Tax=Marinobacter halotolerans TaxID=1569211 RepID=UPI001245B18C|nr:catabolite repressor/activator [Marinobacter halotolerans]
MTLAELARLAGVSRTTASYVINGQGPARRIKQATIDRVLATAREYHFQIDTQAAALRGGASRTLGFILPDLENASYARLAKLLEQGARARGYQLLIAGSGDDPETERELARSLKARRCDVLIVASALAPDDPFYQQMQQDGLPVIAVDRAQSPGLISCVVSDNRKGAAALTRSVLEPGTDSVVWLDALPDLVMTRERRRGFEEVARTRGARWSVCSGDHYDRATGAALMHRVLAEQGLPDALITASYTLLQGVLDTLLEQPGGLPESLRIATFGDDRLLDFLPVRVHSLPQKHEAIAEATLERALAAISGHSEPETIIINRSLKRRR